MPQDPLQVRVERDNFSLLDAPGPSRGLKHVETKKV